MISAREANKKSNDSITESLNNEVRCVEACILEACKAGKHKTYYYASLSPDALDFIQEQGYKIDTYAARNEVTTTISWD